MVKTKTDLKATELDRFFSKVILDNECWIWIGALTTGGYGKFKSGHLGLTDSHRLSYFLFKGDIEGKVIMHSCDMPSCVNPDHLVAGSYSDNTRDMYRKGRNGKTTVEDRDNIKKLYALGNLLSDIGGLYGISRGNIGKIVRGERYAF